MGDEKSVSEVKSLHNQVLDLSSDHEHPVLSDQSNPKLYDDDGRPKRTGNYIN